MLKTKAMLAGLKITGWTARKMDKNVTQEVHSQHNVDNDAGRYNKALLARHALSDIQAASNAARQAHYSLTAPWLDDGARILPANLYMKYCEEMREHRKRFETAVETFFDGYDTYVDQAQARLGDMFDANEYPTMSQLQHKFTFETMIAPIPDGDDFRVDLSQDVIDTLAVDVENRTRDALTATTQHVADKISETVTRIAERLKNYKPATADAKASGMFRDSLIQNAHELVDILPDLNIADDENMKAAINDLRNLTRFDADRLRYDPIIRGTIATEADDILAKIKGYQI